MAFHDCDVEEADILEVQSVSDMFSAFKTPAADAVKLIGGDDIAVFSPQLGLMVVTSQYDLEEPATTSQTVILSLADAECTWPDPPEYISDIVFECRWPSGANLVTEFQTFSDENATPSPSLEHYRERFSEGGICTVFSECDEAYLLDLEEDPDMEPLSGGKVDACVRNILDIRRRTEAERGAQLVFVDSSTPASGRWNIQDDVRRRLIEAGVPESEIACVTDAKGKSKQKEALYEKVRSGDIRILLGSTTTLGTGTNVQTRLAAIHDLDCPWRPSDLEQRLGRIVRQGRGIDRAGRGRRARAGALVAALPVREHAFTRRVRVPIIRAISASPAPSARRTA